MRHKEKLLVIDTETCNSVLEPIPYDIGYLIADRSGHIYVKRSYVVAETFIDMKDVMQSAYYAEKIPKYWDDIKAGSRKLKSTWSIWKQIRDDMKEYNIKKVCAYNASFDKQALNNLMRYITKSSCRWFFPFGTEYIDIWNVACMALMKSRNYIRFAEQNGLVSDNNNIKTSAECCYRYITKTVNFIESHTGLEDCKIELEILLKCYRTHKKLDTQINKLCWLEIQKHRKKLRGM